MTRPGLTALLTVVYAATLGSAAPLDLLVGAALAAFIAAAVGRARRAATWHRRLRGMPRAVAAVVREIFSGTWTMLRVLIGMQSWRHLGVVEIDAAGMSGREIAMTGWIVTVSPGSVLLEVDETKAVMRFNVIDAREPGEFRDEVSALADQALRAASA